MRAAPRALVRFGRMLCEGGDPVLTPQAVALEAKPPLVITHAPGHMFITDLPDHALAAL